MKKEKRERKANIEKNLDEHRKTESLLTNIMNNHVQDYLIFSCFVRVCHCVVCTEVGM